MIQKTMHRSKLGMKERTSNAVESLTRVRGDEQDKLKSGYAITGPVIAEFHNDSQRFWTMLLGFIHPSASCLLLGGTQTNSDQLVLRDWFPTDFRSEFASFAYPMAFS
jgi:hypothetical protein